MQPERHLSLFDSVCIIVGIIVGVGIFETPAAVAGSVNTASATLLVWVLGGLLALGGALCYAELASAYPQEGGDYVYLTRAYGSWAGYLFGWSQLAIVRPGDIALMAFIFGRYGATIYAPFEHVEILYAVLAVVILTGLNMGGVRAGKLTQNLLTVVKVLGLLVIVGAGFAAPAAEAVQVGTESSGSGGLRLALILVMFTFGGWNEMAYVSAEVKRPERNIARALIFGAVTVTVLYLLINAAYLHALGVSGMAKSQAVAIETLAPALPSAATRAVTIIICISALGAVNGLVFTGARISYAMGRDHSIFRRMGRWDEDRGTPIGALAVQGTLSLIIILLAGSFLDIIIYTTPVVWTFFLATGLSVFVLRRREEEASRPFRVPGYPVTPLIFCACCIFMLYSSVTYAYTQKPLGLLISTAVLLAGAVLLASTSYGTASGSKGV